MGLAHHSLYGSVVEHWSAESEGLKFNSSRELNEDYLSFSTIVTVVELNYCTSLTEEPRVC